ncbi:class I SAM-dependent methyltransferase [Mongoliitalea daihaiensis]|uniref:class I SAM-dependent methyltransferase n=1 Tax=Mongoliitalea daihaiensis TaxID=2782006 RepID=UPI001F374318|nr:class I SAM-dependent methyltransferase [Mongoliitalea daihaiensis]UJP66480.1 class I SAM-dependent methyltransferase [Mongoliitalea daihaiensis]
MGIEELNHLLGNIDIYLLDQILKGRFKKEMNILDVGCGEGRNCIYFLREGYKVFGIDPNPTAIQMARVYARSIQPEYDLLRFQEGDAREIPFHPAAFDAVISSAVLHFADSEEAFMQMFAEHLRVLKPGGLFFLRMCTDAGGILAKAPHLGDGVYVLPDGSERFVLKENLLNTLLETFPLSYVEAPKSVLVHGQRAMGVLVFEKGYSFI